MRHFEQVLFFQVESAGELATVQRRFGCTYPSNSMDRFQMKNLLVFIVFLRLSYFRIQRNDNIFGPNFSGFYPEVILHLVNSQLWVLIKPKVRFLSVNTTGFFWGHFRPIVEHSFLIQHWSYIWLSFSSAFYIYNIYIYTVYTHIFSLFFCLIDF